MRLCESLHKKVKLKLQTLICCSSLPAAYKAKMWRRFLSLLRSARTSFKSTAVDSKRSAALYWEFLMAICNVTKTLLSKLWNQHYQSSTARSVAFCCYYKWGQCFVCALLIFCNSCKNIPVITQVVLREYPELTHPKIREWLTGR